MGGETPLLKPLQGRDNRLMTISRRPLSVHRCLRSKIGNIFLPKSRPERSVLEIHARDKEASASQYVYYDPNKLQSTCRASFSLNIWHTLPPFSTCFHVLPRLCFSSLRQSFAAPQWCLPRLATLSPDSTPSLKLRTRQSTPHDNGYGNKSLPHPRESNIIAEGDLID